MARSAKRRPERTFKVLKAKHGLNRYELTAYDGGLLVVRERLKDDVAVALAKVRYQAQGYDLTEEGELPIIYREVYDGGDEGDDGEG